MGLVADWDKWVLGTAPMIHQLSLGIFPTSRKSYLPLSNMDVFSLETSTKCEWGRQKQFFPMGGILSYAFCALAQYSVLAIEIYLKLDNSICMRALNFTFFLPLGFILSWHSWSSYILTFVFGLFTFSFFFTLSLSMGPKAFCNGGLSPVPPWSTATLKGISTSYINLLAWQQPPWKHLPRFTTRPCGSKVPIPKDCSLLFSVDISSQPSPQSNLTEVVGVFVVCFWQICS